TDTDVKALKDNARDYHLSVVSAYTSSNSELTLHDKGNDGKDQTQQFVISGTDPSYFGIQGLSVKKGNNFTEADVTNKNKVAVLGAEAAVNLFGSDDPIGKTIKLEDDDYTIIGILASKEQTGFN